MKLLDWIDRALVGVAVLALILLTSLITVSVAGRYLFSAPVPDDLVLSEILMVFVAFLPLSFVQALREHVFVTVFTDWLPNTGKVMLETFGVLLGAVIFSVIAWAVFTDFFGAWKIGSYQEGTLEIPEWPGRFIVALGLMLFAVRLVIDSVLSVMALAAGTARVASKGEAEQVLEREL